MQAYVWYTDCRMPVPTSCLQLSSLQPLVTAHAKMEGPAQLLTLAPVMWGGLECGVQQVGEWPSNDLVSILNLHRWVFHCMNF